MAPSTSPAKQISGGQREEGHGVVHHAQGEHHQTYSKMKASRLDKFSAGLTNCRSPM